MPTLSLDFTCPLEVGGLSFNFKDPGVLSLIVGNEAGGTKSSERPLPQTPVPTSAPLKHSLTFPAGSGRL